MSKPSIHLPILLAVLLVACKGMAGLPTQKSALLLPTPTVTISPTATAPQPSATPTATPQPILSTNVYYLKRLAQLGKGVVLKAGWSPDSQMLAVRTYLGIYLFDTHSWEEKMFLSSPIRSDRAVDESAYPAEFDWDLGVGTSFSFPAGEGSIFGGFTFETAELVLSYDAQKDQMDLKDTVSDRVLQTFPLIAAVCASVSPDRRYLALGNEGLTLLDVSAGEALWETSLPYPCARFLFSQDGRFVLMEGKYKNKFQVWDVIRGQLVMDSQEFAGPLVQIAFSPDGQYIAAGSYTGEIYLWDIPSLVLETTIQAHWTRVTGLEFSRDGRILASGGDSSVVLWDIPSGDELNRITNTKAYVNALSFSPDGKTLAIAYSNDSTQLWDIQSLTMQQNFEAKKSPVFVAGSVPDVYQVASSPNGLYLAAAVWAGPAAGRVLLWKVNDGSLRPGWWWYPRPINHVEFSPDGEHYLVSFGSCYVWMVGVEQGEIQKFPCTDSPSDSYAIFNSSGKLIAASGENEIWFYDITTKQVIMRLEDHLAPIAEIAFGRNGELLATVSYDGLLRIWHLER